MLADQLDRLGRAFWRKATHDYFVGTGKLTNYQATRLWTMVGEYLVQLAEAYEFCLARMETGGREGDAPGQWAELDPTNNRVAGEDYVTLAIGRDYADVSPMRGVIHGGARHQLRVAVTVTPLA